MKERLRHKAWLGRGSSIHRETPRKSVRHLTQQETCSGGSKPRVPCRGRSQRASSLASRVLLLLFAPSPSSEFLSKLLLELLFDCFGAAASQQGPFSFYPPAWTPLFARCIRHVNIFQYILARNLRPSSLLQLALGNGDTELCAVLSWHIWHLCHGAVQYRAQFPICPAE